MPYYKYLGRNPANQESEEGVIECSSAQEVMNILSDKGMIPISVEETEEPEVEGSRELKQFQIFKRVTLDELVMFSRQCAQMTRAGVPITRCFRGIANTTKKNPYFCDALNHIADELEKGNQLSTCLNMYPKIFNALYVNMIHVGENTGQLDQAFTQMHQYLTLERQTVRSVKSAVRYPLFVFGAIGIAIAILNWFVIPAFAEVFHSFGNELPWQTQVLIGVSDFFVEFWYVVVGTFIGLGVSYFKWKKTESGRYLNDKWALSAPLIGKVLNKITLGRFSRTFAIMMKAGISIEKALVIVGNALDNRYIGDKVSSLRTYIEQGESVLAACTKADLFSELVIQMIAVGEETGRIDEMLEEAASYYEEEVEYDLKALAAAIEPIMITIIGAMVLVLALGIFLPLWELNTAVNH
ncbi:type II secretion system F family protein [Neptuniibacter sp. QD37_11]|uniref:type II secretion system F family protein n=1 Tax=Neptuniibacter sp. QD37_11 TaxID=3398209 RepID=UPI0039F529D2